MAEHECRGAGWLTKIGDAVDSARDGDTLIVEAEAEAEHVWKYRSAVRPKIDISVTIKPTEFQLAEHDCRGAGQTQRIADAIAKAADGDTLIVGSMQGSEIALALLTEQMPALENVHVVVRMVDETATPGVAERHGDGPDVRIKTAGGVTTMVMTAGTKVVTSTVAVPRTTPAVAVIIKGPPATAPAVKSPDSAMVPPPVVDHRAPPGMATPNWSNSWAANGTPVDVCTDTAAGVTMRVVAVWVTVVETVSRTTSPPPSRIVTSNI